MGHGKETPRQKMIGMMYLVLTALLALNVSKDILNAFIIVDEGLVKTTQNFTEKNSFLYEEFGTLNASNPSKAGPWNEKAMDVKKKASDLFDMIQNLKAEIVKKADKTNDAIGAKNSVASSKIVSKDNTNIPAEIMVGDNNNGKGKELKAKFVEFRETLIKYVEKDELLKKTIENALETSDATLDGGIKETWESKHFEHLPLIAVTTIMTNLQSDIRNVESDVVKYLLNQVDAGSFKFNKLEPVVIVNSDYVLKGGEYKAEIFMAAFDTTQNPTIYTGQVQEIKLADGSFDYQIVGGNRDSLPIDPITKKGIYKRSAGSVGSVKWGGIIQLKATDGSIIRKPFKREYLVAESGAVISPTKMNVFYIGVDNPVSISVPGVGSDKITAFNTNGLIRKEGTGWIVNPKNVGTATLTVNAKIDGKDKAVGNMLFRVKTIPDPVAKVAGKKGGGLDKNILLAQSIVQADLEGFDFDAKFTVTEFTVSATIKSFSQDVAAKGTSRISEKQKDIIRNLNRGDRVYFQDIKAIGPDGKPRELNTVYFKIQ